VNGCAIRPARLEDVGAVLAIERDLATAPHWAKAEYLRIVQREGALRRCLLVGEEDGEMVGFAVGVVVAGVGELESVAVRASRQGRGFGPQLVRAVLGWCKAEGAAEVELEVRAASTGPQRVYLRLGFVVVGRRPAYYSDPADDAVLMRIGLMGWFGVFSV
jgi:ribosomal-protein-alanine N-acetyltransferase